MRSLTSSMMIVWYIYLKNIHISMIEVNEIIGILRTIWELSAYHMMEMVVIVYLRSQILQPFMMKVKL